jgi:hypothetical protein
MDARRVHAIAPSDRVRWTRESTSVTCARHRRRQCQVGAHSRHRSHQALPLHLECRSLLSLFSWPRASCRCMSRCSGPRTTRDRPPTCPNAPLIDPSMLLCSIIQAQILTKMDIDSVPGGRKGSYSPGSSCSAPPRR